MGFSGDSIQYLRMANQINNGFIPSSTLWMPLYSTMIWITSKIFVIEILMAAKIYNFLLGLLIIIFYNRLFVFNLTANFTNRLLLNIPIFISQVCLLHFTSIMAEIQFLLLTIILIHSIYKILKFENYLYYVFIACFVAVLCFMTKYNGSANIAFLGAVLIYKFRWESYKYLLLLFGLVLIFYLPYLMIKPGSEFLFQSIKIGQENGVDFLNKIISDFFKSVTSYLLPYRINTIIYVLIDKYPIYIFGYFIYAGIGGFLAKKIYQGQTTISVIIIAYSFLYITLIVYKYYSWSFNEMNNRTIFYVLFFMSFVVTKYIVLNQGTLHKTLYFIFVLICISRTLNAIPNMFTKGNGRLAEPALQIDSPIILAMKDIIKKKEIKSEQIFSNEHAVLAIHTNFDPIGELPSSRIFLGNNYLTDSILFSNQLRNFCKVQNKKKWLIVYFLLPKTHPRFDSYLHNYIIEMINTKKFVTIKTFQGYCIYPKCIVENDRLENNFNLGDPSITP